MKISTCVFDAYGTLFDVTSAARHALANVNPELGQTVAKDWRLKQLQYTWIRAITHEHADFWQVTCDSLDWALEQSGLLNDDQLRNSMLSLFRKLDAYPEVEKLMFTLSSLKINIAILSNGSPNMLKTAVEAAGVENYIDDLLSVEAVGVYKPSPLVYDLVGKRFGCMQEQVLFISSNGWDAAAATGYGFNSVWVNRMQEPVDRLPWKPHYELSDLTGIPDLLA